MENDDYFEEKIQQTDEFLKFCDALSKSILSLNEEISQFSLSKTAE